ncbi:hypothetical protein [Lysinibacter sp. HNR]|uniref:hypothetical protein n=1 Tax=Lysinibacter sp. HNR TaxID=3031408 RepID=UPI002435AA0A|nr:hypothetical protein [Lysinibacter sp. HNR]WGD38068.1 hypothetical protein FrondiHNR_03890 [Lysinibacter sp. HNR]
MQIIFNPTQKNFSLRRSLIYVTVSVLCSALVGCGTPGKPSSRTTPGSTAAAETETALVPTEETYSQDGQGIPENQLPSNNQADVPSVFIPNWEWDKEAKKLSVAAFLTSPSEDPGVCTLTARTDRRTERTQSPAITDATTTICEALTLDSPPLTSGTWVVTVSYTSKNLDITSDPESIEIP